MKSRIASMFAALTLLLPACAREIAEPEPPNVQLAPLAGDAQFGLPSTALEEPLQVVATDAVTEDPVEGVRIEWRVVSGSGSVLAATSTTDARGLATTVLQLGSQLGTYEVEATTERLVGDPARFRAEAVQRPAISGIAPAIANAGDTVTVTGSNFNPIADYNDVIFAGVRGHVVSATGTELRVVVPACVPTRTVEVRVALGAVMSTPFAIAATGAAVEELALAPGEVRVISDPEELGCLRLPGSIPSASWLMVVQNAANVYSATMPFELTTLNGSAPFSFAKSVVATRTEDWEQQLRQRERALFGGRVMAPSVAPQQVDPEIGDRRTFRALTSDQQESVTVEAEVRFISERAIMYVDLQAPANGWSLADLSAFGQLFDDPIYPITASVFGSPSDIDANGRIIILFTPRVNALTPRGEGSYVAGYFYGCDLVEAARCADTNSGEIFYSLVPDPSGQFGDARSASELLRNVPPVLAHEFQHMISFAQRDESLDALWLSEALAHMAEDVVGDALAQTGQTTLARDFRRPNYLRAHRYLDQIDAISMIAEDDQGSIELRGAGWLFLRYLRGQYGGNALLAELTQTTLSSTQNVTTATEQPWAVLLSDFALALFADGAPELTGVALPARYTFTDFNPRTAITQEAGSWPLQPMVQTLGDGGITGDLPSSSSSYLQLNAPAGSTSYPAVNLLFTGVRGGPFRASTVPQLSVMRLR